jgi:hypothetical protein
MSRYRPLTVLLAGCGVAAIGAAALADPPARVGRISDLEGAVSFQPPGGQDWAQALRNYPVTAGEAFWTGDDGRAELELGGVQARLDYQTELDVVNLEYGETRLSEPQGSVDIRLWRVPENGVTIATPAGDVQLNQPGAYRVDVGAPDQNDAYPPVEVTAVEGGAAGAPGVNGFVDVPPGAAAVIYAGYDPDLQDAQDAAIDDWARDREAQHRYARYDWQAETETGYQDLASYGQFASDPDYGQVWFPSDVPPDWAPYRYGQWSYVQPWGWTWIDDQPWGFAPFHYGRWLQIDGRWGWVRGQPVARPVYAPALVAFLGGAGFGVAIGPGAGAVLAWAPLAPNEPYIPPYSVSQSYVRQVNITSVNRTVINNITINNTQVVQASQLRNASAAVAVPVNHLATGAKVQQAVVRVPPQALAQASVAPTAAPPAPPPAARRPGAGAPGEGATGAGLRAAPPPPARLQQVRTAVAQTPPGSHAPPPIPGAHKAAEKPPVAAGAPPVIAPAARQGREPPPKPAATRAPSSPGTEPGRPIPRQPPPTAERPQGTYYPSAPPGREMQGGEPQTRRASPNPPPGPPPPSYPRQASPPQGGPEAPPAAPSPKAGARPPPSPDQERPSEPRNPSRPAPPPPPPPPPRPQAASPRPAAPAQPRPENKSPPPNEKKKPPPPGSGPQG